MATHALEGARRCAKSTPTLYDRIAADNRAHPLERTRHWQDEADRAAEYGRQLRTRGKTPVQAAGERLDTAGIMRRLISDDTRTQGVEEMFASVEREYVEARKAYLAELVALTGETAADLERRVGA